MRTAAVQSPHPSPRLNNKHRVSTCHWLLGWFGPVEWRNSPTYTPGEEEWGKGIGREMGLQTQQQQWAKGEN